MPRYREPFEVDGGGVPRWRSAGERERLSNIFLNNVSFGLLDPPRLPVSRELTVTASSSGGSSVRATKEKENSLPLGC